MHHLCSKLYIDNTYLCVLIIIGSGTLTVYLCTYAYLYVTIVKVYRLAKNIGGRKIWRMWQIGV